MQVIAFLDRIHAYVPGWEIPKLSHDSYAKDYGFITDYFCEIMHEMKRAELLSAGRSRFDFIDTANTGQGISGRDQRAVDEGTLVQWMRGRWFKVNFRAEARSALDSQQHFYPYSIIYL